MAGEIKAEIQELSKQDLDKAKLSELIKKFTTAKVLVLGDLILDEYLLGSPERISREAPVIILDYIHSDFALGGAANAASNIASYQAKTNLLGVTGNDNGSEQITRIAKEQNIKLDAFCDDARATTIKTRIISTSNNNADNGTILKQQVLRVDRQSRQPISSRFEKKIFDKFTSLIDEIDIVLLSDYASGVLTEELAAKITDYARAHKKAVVVDANNGFEKYKNAYILTPNQPDAEAMVGFKIKSDEDLLTAGKKLLEITAAEYILLTRGAKGMALFSQAGVQLLPAFNLSEVFDVTGAGDTVTGTLSVALAVGAEPIEAAILGNLAASIVVRKYGTASVSQAELNTVLNDI